MRRPEGHYVMYGKMTDSDPRHPLINKVKNWLRQTGNRYNENEPDAETFILTIVTGNDFPLDIMFLKEQPDAVDISAGLQLDDATYMTLFPKDKKSHNRAFLASLSIALCAVPVGFQTQARNGGFDQLRVFATVFEDGLSKTVFFDAINAVQRGLRVASELIARELGHSTSNTLKLK